MSSNRRCEAQQLNIVTFTVTLLRFLLLEGKFVNNGSLNRSRVIYVSCISWSLILYALHSWIKGQKNTNFSVMSLYYRCFYEIWLYVYHDSHMRIHPCIFDFQCVNCLKVVFPHLNCVPWHNMLPLLNQHLFRALVLSFKTCCICVIIYFYYCPLIYCFWNSTFQSYSKRLKISTMTFR